MKKMKKIVFAIVSVLVFTPALALAQFAAPEDTNLPTGSLTNIITSAMKWLLIVVGILGVVGFVIAGIIYLTAAGDEGQIERGKQTMVYSIVGIIVALIGVVMITAIKGLLGGSSTSF